VQQPEKVRVVKPVPRPATILVVDDSPVNLQVLVRTLDGSGHRILVATGGKAAVEIAQRARPDLVLLDVMMPDMDGFEVCTRIKSQPAHHDTVVIFLSALGEVSDKVAGLELGATDYITKPIQAEEVLARVSTHLTRQQLEREVRLSRDSLDRELASAAEMQRLILPDKLDDIGCLRFAAHYQTSRYAGGDYYDVVELPEERCGVLVADVSGHGANSAIIMAMMRTAFHAYPGAAENPEAVLKFINRQFDFLWGSPMLATAFYAVIDGRSRRATMACAGHLPPLMLRRGEVTAVRHDATIPLLLMDMRAVPYTAAEFESGDLLLFYTDGITERENRHGEMYEIERLCKALARFGQLPPEKLVEAIVQDVEAFAGGAESADDQTLLVVAVS
jgi:serine phosphatase RsbU (regulator of sigma subunit)